MAISDEAANCPTRRLEFVLYSQEAVAQRARRPRFEIKLNAGPEMDYHLSFDPASEPAHWFALDISIPFHHRLGLAIRRDNRARRLDAIEVRAFVLGVNARIVQMLH